MAAGLPAEATIALDDVAGAVREGLLGLSCSAGLLVMPQIVAEEMTAKVGSKGLHSPERITTCARALRTCSRCAASA